MGWAIKVTPPDRGADVIHYLITGQLFCGRSLEGVTWEQVEDKRLDKWNASRRLFDEAFDGLMNARRDK